MRKMTEQEMLDVIALSNWANICTVGADNRPYAIEATPFPFDGHVAFMINPRGTTYKNLKTNNNVLLKYTYSELDLSAWAGVSCYGVGEFINDPELIHRGWMEFGEMLDWDVEKAADRFSKNPERSPMFLVKITEMTGRCKAKVGEPLVLPERIDMKEFV